jgi:hypothetical protein
MNEAIPRRGHHKIAAAVFVGALIIGCALVLAAELMKPARYEFHAVADQNSYLLFDKDTGRSTIAKAGEKDPTSAFAH